MGLVVNMKKRIVVDSHRTQRGSQSQTMEALNACMELGGSIYGGLKETGSYILSKRGRKRQPSFEESVLTGRKPDIGF